MKVAVWPTVTAALAGWVVMVGGATPPVTVTVPLIFVIAMGWLLPFVSDPAEIVMG